AIGTGKTPKAEEVQEVAQHIKDYATLKNIDVTVLYGGSVQEKNSQDFLALPAVDGLLVGSAALDPKALCKIANVR
ncbi:MAG: triose-phosphate isomerase, partial [Holosporaceae bacterium]